MSEDEVFTFERENFLHLNDAEWGNVMELAVLLGERAALSLFRDSSAAQQQASVRAYMLQKKPPLPPPSPRVVTERPLKVPISTYSGNEGENLPRWFLEIDMALNARQIEEDHQKVVFLIAYLGGRARAWAFSNAMLNDRVFPTYQALRQDLLAAFQPPKSEFRTRQTFLAIRQGKRSLYDYVQEARSLVADITQEPVDQATQVSVFLSGLRPGPVRSQLFRSYPASLDEAANMAMQEDFASRQSEVPGSQYPRQRTHHGDDGPSPMEICSTEVRTRSGSSNRASVRCFKCDQKGHYARDCRVRGTGRSNGSASSQRGPDRSNERAGYQKNGYRQ